VPAAVRLGELELPIVQAPMGGGPSTPKLAAAVGEAGGLGFLAAGYRSVDEVGADLAKLRALSRRAFGLNLFAPPAAAGDPAAVVRFAERLRGDAERRGVALGEPRHDDDGWEDKCWPCSSWCVPRRICHSWPPAGSPTAAQSPRCWRRARAQRSSAPRRRGRRTLTAERCAAARTVLTRAFTGRPARGIENRFIREHEAAAPLAYPEVHHLTAPLRAAARAEGDPDGLHMWAGETYELARELPAAQLARELAGQAA
jgi:NAD(P)H-dependent flavin oxidoreductase YrpB (nitropropane dioxygenase family)